MSDHHELGELEHRRPSDQERAADAAVAAQTAAAETREMARTLRDLTRQGFIPARITPYTLSAKNGGQVLDAIGHAPDGQPDVALTIGVLNPYQGDTAFAVSARDVYLGLGGSSPMPGFTFPVFKGTNVILPIAAGDIELGVDPANIPPDNQPARIWVLRFAHVQPFYRSGT